MLALATLGTHVSPIGKRGERLLVPLLISTYVLHSTPSSTAAPSGLTHMTIKMASLGRQGFMAVCKAVLQGQRGVQAFLEYHTVPSSQSCLRDSISLHMKPTQRLYYIQEVYTRKYKDQIGNGKKTSLQPNYAKPALPFRSMQLR